MYRAPVAEMAFTLNEVAGLSEGLRDGLFGDTDAETVAAVLEEAGRFAEDVLAPVGVAGDRTGAVWRDGAVTMPPGWRDAYLRWCEGGWSSVTASPDQGGQGLPTFVSVATQEMWNAASIAYGVGVTLTLGAIEAIEAHASDALKALYLPKLASGEWTGTMNLTEPQAGSDLGALRTRAERAGDGTYRIFGQKIFITYGEHDLTDNIVHLVLARLPDAPPGTRGISLFLVPKFIPLADGTPGARNDVHCAGIEEKMGLHASPTCTMIYGGGHAEGGPGAIGWLVGEENRGLACMFTMMNNARLMVGIEGVGVAERALQKATAYAMERRQGRAPGASGGEMSPIIAHPDVRRMLLSMRGLTAASRAICYACAIAIDRARMEADAERRAFWQERANLLTPVAKAFSTDAGVDVASLGLQVHGGMGYIEETGAAQLYRDARIAPIYEGTNGIQAIDLVTRKLPQGGGEAVRGYVRELRQIAEEARASNRAELGRTAERLGAALDDLDAATDHLLQLHGEGRTAEALAGATPYLRLFGLAAGTAYLARGALASLSGDGQAERLRVAVARAFAERHAPETAALRVAVTDGADALLAAGPELLAG